MGEIQFAKSDTRYPIPQTLNLDPQSLRNADEDLYIVPIGAIKEDLPIVERRKLLRAYDEITWRLKGHFLEDFTLYEGNSVLVATLAYVDVKRINSEDVYFIEIAVSDARFETIKEETENVRSRKSNPYGIKGKKINRKRKATSKSKSK